MKHFSVFVIAGLSALFVCAGFSAVQAEEPIKLFDLRYTLHHGLRKWYRRSGTIWDDPNRGKVPMMWCFSPLPEKRVPMGLECHRNTATPNDFFAAADNGKTRRSNCLMRRRFLNCYGSI